jgi:hypothetical protein
MARYGVFEGKADGTWIVWDRAEAHGVPAAGLFTREADARRKVDELNGGRET